MLIFKSEESLSREEYDRWKHYIENCEKVVLLPPFIDFICDTESDNIEREEVEIEEK